MARKSGRDHAWERWHLCPPHVDHAVAHRRCRRCGLLLVLANSGPRGGQKHHYFRGERQVAMGTLALPNTPPCPGVIPDEVA